VPCKPFRSAHVLPGWLCCECRTYNGNHRSRCKMAECRHWRCDGEPLPAGCGRMFSFAGMAKQRCGEIEPESGVHLCLGCLRDTA
jgi:hypothetical protein